MATMSRPQPDSTKLLAAPPTNVIFQTTPQAVTMKLSLTRLFGRQRGQYQMVNLEYHKGSFCVHTPIFCQEGYCAGCEIYKQISATGETGNDHRVATRPRRTPQVASRFSRLTQSAPSLS